MDISPPLLGVRFAPLASSYGPCGPSPALRAPRPASPGAAPLGLWPHPHTSSPQGEKLGALRALPLGLRPRPTASPCAALRVRTVQTPACLRHEGMGISKQRVGGFFVSGFHVKKANTLPKTGLAAVLSAHPCPPYQPSPKNGVCAVLVGSFFNENAL